MRFPPALPIALGTALVLALTAGCTGRAIQGDETVYSEAKWLGWVFLFIGVVFLLGGCLLRSEDLPLRGRLAMVVVGGSSALYGGFAIPGGEKVTVGPQHFEVRTGSWFWQNAKSIRFEDLSALELMAISEGRRSTSYKLKCSMKAGETEIIAVGDALTDAVPEIVARAMDRGIPIGGLVGGRLPFVFGPIPQLGAKPPQ